MKRALLSASFIALLAACDGNPLDPVPGVEPGASGGADNSATDTCDENGVVCSGEANLFTYDDGGTPGDDTDDTLSINNLPFDLDGNYTRDVAFDVGPFRGYTNDAGDEVYVALYNPGTWGGGAGVVSTDGYLEFGYGGTVIRSAGATLPSAGEAVFEGAYGGLRVPDTLDGVIEVVEGTARMRLDFEDFDVVGAIDGTIFGRSIVGGANDGEALPSLSMSTTGFDGIQIQTTPIVEVIPPDGDEETPTIGMEGELSAFFAGTVGPGLESEIAGVVVMIGPDALDDTGEINILERGAFVIPQTSFTAP